MKAQGITKRELASRMHTSRSQLDRFLDPDNSKVLLETVQRAAAALGKRVLISFENEPRQKSARAKTGRGLDPDMRSDARAAPPSSSRGDDDDVSFGEPRDLGGREPALGQDLGTVLAHARRLASEAGPRSLHTELDGHGGQPHLLAFGPAEA